MGECNSNPYRHLWFQSQLKGTVPKPFYHDIDELILWLIDTIEIDKTFYDGGERSVLTSITTAEK